MLKDFKIEPASERYKLMSQTIIPRPIAWIVTESQDGVVNIAPFSFFSGVSSNPPTLMVAIGHKKGTKEPKDTLKNIRESKKCVVCSVNLDDASLMNLSATELSYEQSEAEIYNIETKVLLDDFPPIISSTSTAFFCTLSQEITLEGSKTIPLFLNIEKMYIDDDVISDEGNLELDLVGRLGKEFVLLGERIKFN